MSEGVWSWRFAHRSFTHFIHSLRPIFTFFLHHCPRRHQLSRYLDWIEISSIHVRQLDDAQDIFFIRFFTQILAFVESELFHSIIFVVFVLVVRNSISFKILTFNNLKSQQYPRVNRNYSRYFDSNEALITSKVRFMWSSKK